MINSLKKITLATTMALSLTACEGNNEAFGSLLGAGLGAWMGSEIGSGSAESAVLGIWGAGIGAAIGGGIGRKLDERDRLLMEQTYQESFEYRRSGEASTWYNPDSGNYGSITPQPAVKEDNRYCREYTQTITIGGKTEEAYGKACRMPDGSWKIEN